MMISVEKGRMLSVPSEWVFFILSNTDIMTTISRAPLSLDRCGEHGYRGSVFGVTVSMEILGDRQPLPLGNIDIVADVRMPCGLGRTHTVVHYRYRRLDAAATMVDLRFTLETSGMPMGLYARWRRRNIDGYLAGVLDDNEKAAKLVLANDPSLAGLLTEEQLSRIAQYRDLLSVDLAGSDDEGTAQSPTPLGVEHDRMWDAELRELSGLYDGFRGKADSLAVELERIKDARDAVATLLIARRMLEVIVSQLVETMLKRSRGNEPLAGLIDKLDRLEAIPDYVCTSMRNLNSLSTYGAHPKVFSPRQVREALIALCSIMEWHVSCDRPISADTDREFPSTPVEATDVARQEYRHLCKMAWIDGVLHDSEREALEQKRKELSISIEDARQIEAEYVSE